MPSAHPSVDLGRAALSGVSGGDRRLERRRQLGDRALAHRPARRARRSTRWSRAILDRRRRRAASMPRRSGEGPDGYRDRPADVAARRDRAAALAYAFDAAEQAGVLAFRPRGGAPVAELTEDDLVLPDDARAVPPDARAGDRTAARGLARLHRRPAPTTAARRRRRAAWSAARRGSRMPISPSSPMTRRPSAAPTSGCRICGRAARARTSRCRRASSRWRRATSLR